MVKRLWVKTNPPKNEIIQNTSSKNFIKKTLSKKIHQQKFVKKIDQKKETTPASNTKVTKKNGPIFAIILVLRSSACPAS